jgi:type I restriction enzyme S subunit
MKLQKLPKGWSLKPLASLVHPDRKISYGIVQPGEFEPGGILLIRGQDYSDGWAKPEAMFRVSETIDTPYRRSRLKSGDILLTIVGAGTGNIAIVPDYLDGANITQTTARIAVNEAVASRDYVRLVLESHIGRHEVYRNIKGGAQPGLNIGDVEEFNIPIPALSEQTKIAATLMPWMAALEKLDALIAAKARRKQALMQQLLTGHRRLPGSSETVKFIRASEIFTNRTERNSRGAPILSVTQDQGVVIRETLDRKIAHDIETNDTYKVVQPGDYIISLRSFQGGLEYSEILGAVSPAYHVIHPIKDIDREFYRHYFKSADFVGRLAVAVIGIRDGKQISFTDFGFIKLPYPHIEDQRRIGQLLSTADAELRLLRQQRTALDHQKRGLMQQLLTGKKRVHL